MAVTTKKTFPATTNATTTVFSPVSIQLHNQDDLDVYVTLSGGTRVLQLRQSTGSTAQSSHPQVNNTDGLYFPAVSAGTTLYNYQLSSDNNTITFNSALPQGAVVFCERRTRDASGTYTTFASGSTIRAKDLNDSAEQSNFTAQDARNKALDLENAIFNGTQPTVGGVTQPFVNSANIIDGSIATGDIANNAITSPKILDGNVLTSKINDGAVTNIKLADDSVDSRNYIDNSIDTQHIADNQITSAKILDGNVLTSKINDGAVTTVKLADANVTTAKLAEDAVTSDKINASAINADHIGSSAVSTVKIASEAVTTAKIANNAITAAKIASNAVTTDKIADSELSTLASMQSGTASRLADSTALTATMAELNQLDGITLETSVTTNSDTRIPTSKAVNDLVLSVTNALGGFVAIANETSFPTANPDPSNNAGTVVSISQLASGLAVNSSGVATITNGAGTGNTVTITGFPSSLHSQTLPASSGLQVQTTSTLHTYTFHKQLASAADIQAISATVNSFSNRYRVSASAPTSSLDGGDLWYDTTNSKLMVYSSQNSAWEESSAIGNFFISTISSSSATGGGSATANGTAYRFTISNAPTSAQQLLVSVDGVIQKPNAGSSQPSEGFVLVGNDIIFGSAPANGASIFITVIGSTVGIGTPSNNTVTTAILQNASVTTAKIADDAVTTAKIADDAVTSAKLAGQAVNTAAIATGAVVTGHLAGGSVTSAKIQDGTITSFDIADQAITTAKIANDAVTGAKIADDAIDSEHYTDGSIDNAHLAASSVTNTKIADDAITTAKIQNSQITTAKIADANITNGKLASNAVTNTKIADDAITTAKIQDSNITTAKIANSAVTDAKINGMAASKLTGALPAIDGSNLTGLSSGAPFNMIINGEHEIDQRNNGSTVQNTGYVTDRWAYNNASSGTCTGVKNQNAPAGHYHSLKIEMTAADTNGMGTSQNIHVYQNIEGRNTKHLNWGSSNAKSVTVSFWVKSNLTGTYSVALVNHDLNRGQVKEYSISSANTWEKKTLTFAGDTSGTWKTDGLTGIRCRWCLATGSQYGTSTLNTWGTSDVVGSTGNVNFSGTTGNVWRITGVQVEEGDSASNFAYEEYSVTLRKCQRYFQVLVNTSGVYFGTGYMYDHYRAYLLVQYYVEMRSTPSFQHTSGTNYWSLHRQGVGDNFNGWNTAIGGDNKHTALQAQSGLSGTGGTAGGFWSNTNQSKITFESEL